MLRSAQHDNPGKHTASSLCSAGQPGETHSSSLCSAGQPGETHSSSLCSVVKVTKLPGISKRLTCIPAVAISRRIHPWQKHLFTTFVVLRAYITEISLVLIDALSTGSGSRFPA